MPWNPETYNQFKNIRYKPFFDLMEMLSADGLKRGVDIGCGTGEQTAILAERFATASFLGIDSSSEMLLGSDLRSHDRLQFRSQSIESFVNDTTTWDLVFSNAALQWSDDHERLFPQLLAKLNPGGQFAVQMPVQQENVLNRILLEVVQDEPFCGFLNGWARVSPVLSMDEYARILFEAGIPDMQVIQKLYPIIATDVEVLINFISGSALVPYRERMTDEQWNLFLPEYRRRVGLAFKKFPAIYAFKRLLIYGRARG